MYIYMKYMSEVTADQLGFFMIITGIATFVASLVGPIAPYGRYSTHGWGLLINAKLAWVVSLWVKENKFELDRHYSISHPTPPYPTL